jgi:hypothetical protein
MTHSKTRCIGVVFSLLVSILVTACSGGSTSTANSSTPPPLPNPPPIISADPVKLSASRPGDLLEFIRKKIRDRVATRNANPGLTLLAPNVVGVPPVVISASPPPAPTFSNTTVQEQGVDEEDLIKTDGNLLFTLQTTGFISSTPLTARMQTHQRLPNGTIQLLSELDMPFTAGNNESWQGLLLAKSAPRLAMVSKSMTYMGSVCPPNMVCLAAMPITQSAQRVNLSTVNVATPTLPKLEHQLNFDGSLVGVRQIGNVLYVIATHRPNLAVDLLANDTPTSTREAEIAKLTIADVLPKIRIDSGAEQALLSDSDCYLQTANTALDLELTTITAFDLNTAELRRTSRCFLGGSEAIYVAPTHLYVATTRWSYTPSINLIHYPAQISTDIHKFSMSGMAIDYRASGEVPGHLGWDSERKPYRLSEHQNDLRVISFTGITGWNTTIDPQIAPSPATLSILRESGTDPKLAVLAKLPNDKRPAALGKPGEQIYGVRFDANRAYVVTFRQTDPLYVLDLTDPADPKVTGEIHAPGFSDYLFALPENLVLGVGHDASESGRIQGVKVALFDMQNLAQPKLLQSLVFGEAASRSGLDYTRQGINLFTQGSTVRVALPLTLMNSQYQTVAQGLQRIEVNTATRSLQSRSMLYTSSYSYDLWHERSVQINDHVYWLSQGKLGAHPW